MSEPSQIHSASPILRGRFQRPSWLSSGLFALFLGFFLWSLAGAGMSLQTLIQGLPNMGTIVGEMFPPATDQAWALFFVVSVGLGPFAGPLTIIVEHFSSRMRERLLNQIR